MRSVVQCFSEATSLCSYRVPLSERLKSQLRREKSNAGHSGHSKGSGY
nr:MAG TPA: hypothetical protein [Caudoviricetes sp.]DAQ10544.1 MAG TPA: hypothetical protein [Bacteriophage sp.]DAK50712.1 MAG TPA: hypothetical protein [Caudoviricetes sp.]DAN61346.1 MAG TPA: hypothetical protein [Caudoviricetes sp.]DAN74653.1 MAG TPA: hypothetical protein [Caudoviricetes sp.]